MRQRFEEQQRQLRQQQEKFEEQLRRELEGLRVEI
jgi:hypothetical protein